MRGERRRREGEREPATPHACRRPRPSPPTPPFALCSSKTSPLSAQAALHAGARGLAAWKACLSAGLLPDDAALAALTADPDSALAGQAVPSLAWPDPPLRAALIRVFGRLGAPRFAAKYDKVRDALLTTVVQAAHAHARLLAPPDVVDDDDGEPATEANPGYKTARELAEEEAAKRAARAAAVGGQVAATAQVTAVTAAAAEEEEEEEEEEEDATDPSTAAARRVAAAVDRKWAAPLSSLAAAGRAFDGLEALLGGAAFDVDGAVWRRKGWAEMDTVRAKLEDLKELRDLVRSLGRGGGWGPLRRAAVQHLDPRGRPGLLRTVLEAQETRGLTRTDDISRLLPSEAALLARGRTVRQARLLFYAKLAEKALQTYERDGWGEYDTRVDVDRREVRPTADRGPILLCVDTSGSMRGPRELVAKALTLECMRAAKAQERGCFVFAFAGPADVAELELSMDAASVDRLLGFLEKTFNGGSDFNEPIARCLGRLTDRAWANSDILIVSDGELRQPGQDVMRKLAGAKDKLGLRVHGLVVGAPDEETARADPAVLRSLCSCVLPNGRLETLVHTFESWASVREDAGLAAFDWDDAAGNAARRAAGLALEEARNAEARRLRLANKHLIVKPPPAGGRKKRGAEAVVGRKKEGEGEAEGGAGA